MNDDERRLISRSRQEQRLVLTRFDDADAWGLPMHGQQPETVRARLALGENRVPATLAFAVQPAAY